MKISSLTLAVAALLAAAGASAQEPPLRIGLWERLNEPTDPLGRPQFWAYRQNESEFDDLSRPGALLAVFCNVEDKRISVQHVVMAEAEQGNVPTRVDSGPIMELITTNSGRGSSGSLVPKQASRVRGASFGCASCHRADLAASTGLFCRLARG